MRELKKTLKSKLWSELEEKLYKEPNNQNVRKNLLLEMQNCLKGFYDHYVTRDFELIDYDPVFYDLPNFEYGRRVYRNSAKQYGSDKFYLLFGAADIFGATVHRPFSFGLSEFLEINSYNFGRGGLGITNIYECISGLREFTQKAEFIIIGVTSLRSVAPFEQTKLINARFFIEPETGQKISVQHYLDNLFNKDKRKFIQVMADIENRSIEIYKAILNLVYCPTFFVFMPNKRAVANNVSEITPISQNGYPQGVTWEYLNKLRDICPNIIIPDKLHGCSYAVDRFTKLSSSWNFGKKTFQQTYYASQETNDDILMKLLKLM